MPNICENELSIIADGDDQEALLKKLTKRLESEDSEFDFNNLIPSPDWDNTPNEDGELPSEVEEIRNSNGLLVMSVKSSPPVVNLMNAGLTGTVRTGEPSGMLSM